MADNQNNKVENLDEKKGQTSEQKKSENPQDPKVSPEKATPDATKKTA